MASRRIRSRLRGVASPTTPPPSVAEPSRQQILAMLQAVAQVQNQLFAEVLSIKKLLSSNGVADTPEATHPLLTAEADERDAEVPAEDSDDSDDSDDEHSLSEEDVNGDTA